MGNKRKWTEDEVAELEKDYMAYVDIKTMETKYNRTWKSIYHKAKSCNIIRDRVEIWDKKCLESLAEDYHNHLPKKEMIKKYNRSWSAIQCKVFQLGCSRKMKTKLNLPFTNEEIIEMYKSGKSTLQLGKICGCADTTIGDILKSNGVKARSYTESSRIYTINENYFDVIDNEEKAYILGLLYADGYNGAKGMIALKLQDKDVHILHKINEIIESNRPLRYIKTNKEKWRDVYCLHITSQHMSAQLSRLGCTRAKSLTLQFPTEEQVPNHLHSHFLRGYFDGDGCIHIPKKGSSFAFTLTGNEDFVIGAQNVLMSELGLNRTKIMTKKLPTKSSVNMVYNGRVQAKRILDYLYKDATIYFHRKHDKYKQL